MERIMFAISLGRGAVGGGLYPLCLQHVQKMLQIPWRWIVVYHPAIQDVPDMLSWGQMRTVGWPIHAGDLIRLQVQIYKLSPMWRGVVILR